MCQSQADESLLTIVVTVVFTGKHRRIKSFHAARQVNVVLAQVPFSLGRVVDHGN
jgi:hypothetical protein